MSESQRFPRKEKHSSISLPIEDREENEMIASNRGHRLDRVALCSAAPPTRIPPSPLSKQARWSANLNSTQHNSVIPASPKVRSRAVVATASLIERAVVAATACSIRGTVVAATTLVERAVVATAACSVHVGGVVAAAAGSVDERGIVASTTHFVGGEGLDGVGEEGDERRNCGWVVCLGGWAKLGGEQNKEKRSDLLAGIGACGCGKSVL